MSALPSLQKVSIGDLEIHLVWRRIENEMDLDLWDSLTDEERQRFSKISHEGRKREWSEGRRALRELPRECKVTSLAHTESLALAAGANSPTGGLGVDLEPLARELSSRTEEWLGHDERWTHSPLETWTVKEACFKADRESNEGLVLADYLIESKSRARTKQDPPRRFEYRVLNEGDWIVALAIIVR